MNIDSNFSSKKKKEEKFFFNFRITERNEKLLERVMIWGKGVSDFYSSQWLYDEVHHSFMANMCNKSISQLGNSCKWDLNYDLQYKDFFYFPERREIGINIYCKKSGEEKWNLVKNYILEKSGY